MDHTVGTLDGTHPVPRRRVYDLASITKVAATANALMHMAGTGWTWIGQMHELLPSWTSSGHPLPCGNSDATKPDWNLGFPSTEAPWRTARGPLATWPLTDAPCP